MFFYRALLLFCLVSSVSRVTGQNNIVKNDNNWLYQLISLPFNSTSPPAKSITIAIIDDGFRFSHKELQNFMYENTNEISGNNIDDDNNNYVDDYNGWDISDNDNNVVPPAGREDEFYHGTAIAGIITGIARYVYGNQASKYIKILPVKVLSNRTGNTAILDGYKGIKYALTLNPDIICCAWGGEVTPSDEEKEIVKEAREKGIIVIASSGNLFSEKNEYPASLPGVWSIAATDTLNRKLPRSNYSMRADFALPGINIKAPHPIADNSYFKADGTSISAAIMTGCTGIIKLQYPQASTETIEEALKNTALPLDSLNNSYCGKLGAGIPNIQKAINYLSAPEKRYIYQNPAIPKGTIVFNPKEKHQSKYINPAGAYEGYFIHPTGNYEKLKGTVKIFSTDSLVAYRKVSELPKNMFIPGSSLRIELNAPLKTAKLLSLIYSTKTIDSTKLFCGERKYFKNSKGEINDGSEKQNYANHCNCEWEITVPQGKRIKLDFSEFDTQAKIDFVWLFDGDITLPENIIAKFSGPNIPPSVTSATNKVLVWFVTDGFITGKGWKLKYTAVD